MLSIDIPTQLLDLTLIRLGQAMAFLLLWKIRPDYLPARDWAVGAALATLGLLSPITLSPETVPPLVSVITFNGFMLSGWLVFNAGVVRACGQSVPWRVATALAVVSVVVIAVLAVQLPTSIGWRITMFHACTIVADLYTARCCLNPANGLRSRSLNFIAVALALVVASSLVRVGLSFDPAVTSGIEPLLFNLQFLLISTPLLVITALLLTVQASEAAQQELEHQARRDSLTRTLNRRGFDELASREWARAKRNGSSIGLLTLDIDNFKQVNDAYGHHFGDRVLEAVTGRIQSLLRPEDLFGRMGGDEFLVMLPGSTVEQASLVAERIRIAIAELAVAQDGHTVRVGVSLGVTSVRASEQDSETDWESALRTADLALYAAKREGRDRVVVRS